MLLELEVKNWRSFPHLKFSTIASRERQHGDRVPRLGKYRIRVLPVTAIYGGNASGKTNMFKALAFMQRFVTMPIYARKQVIGVEPFALSSEMATQPSEFKISVLAEGNIYEYSFAVSKKEVLKERLVKILPSQEQVLFERDKDGFNLPDHLPEREHSISDGTESNVLYLTNCFYQKGKEFLPVFRWFAETLTLIAPDTRFATYETFMDNTSPLQHSSIEFLQEFDTGICDIKGEDVSFDRFPLREVLKDSLETLQPNTTARVDFQDDKYFIRRDENDKLNVKKLVTAHRASDGENEVNFSMKQESDGTRRLIDLIPMLNQLVLRPTSKVYIVDELDRSLHYMATKKFLEIYLDSCDENARSQFIFTTHDLLLMTKNMLRRDEMWIMERRRGESRIFSLADFQLSYDKDILKAYLDGRFGGIPRIY